jgi:TetR/AcrR family transcriptional regulator, cholesterol catabolism regulator
VAREAVTKADAQRDRILRAATEIFSRRGYRATSMNEVAAEVGLRKPTLYHYFHSKEELLVRLYEDVLAESLTLAREIVATSGTALGALRELLVSRVVYTCEHKDLLKIFFEEEGELPPDLLETLIIRRREFEDLFLDVVRKSLRAPGVRLSGTPRIYVNTCLGAVNWIYKWYDPAGPRSPRELGEEMAALLLAPFGEPVGSQTAACLTNARSASGSATVSTRGGELTDAAWERIEPLLPRADGRGRRWRDHRQVVNGILWRLRSDAPWRDIPDRYGPWQTCYERYKRWDEDGTWARLLAVVQDRSG